ncbi:MAG TPA: DUF177 domain-containing protein [Candidatus Saccharimonadales bacterium]|nr:DUF177 domain-containing protein [Candidatus Saccharimonadales bacterium]
MFQAANFYAASFGQLLLVQKLWKITQALAAWEEMAWEPKDPSTSLRMTEGGLMPAGIKRGNGAQGSGELKNQSFYSKMTSKSAHMHVDVSQLLQSETGERQTFNIEGERPVFDDVVLTQPVNGQITIMKIDDDLKVTGQLQTSVELECHRCLRRFSHKLEFPLEAEFSSKPNEDQFPIITRGRIDLEEAIRQEIVVHLPTHQLCQADCAGIQLNSKEENGSTQKTNVV